MEEAMRLHKDVPFGWVLAMQTWLSRRTGARPSVAYPAPRARAARLKLVRADAAPLVLEGEMSLELDGRPVVLRSGDFRFIASNPARRAQPADARPSLSWPIGVRGLA